MTFIDILFRPDLDVPTEARLQKLGKRIPHRRLRTSPEDDSFLPPPYLFKDPARSPPDMFVPVPK